VARGSAACDPLAVACGHSRAGLALRHDEDVQTQQSRDDKTVAIATALGIFVILLAVGWVVLWAITSALDLSNHRTSPLFILLVAASAMASVIYLVRVGKR